MEIKSIIKLVIFFFITFYREAWSSNKQPITSSTQNIFKKVKINENDLKFGIAFKEFKKKLRRKKLSEKKIKKLILLSRMSYSFKSYEKILKRGRKISNLSLKNSSGFFKNCKLKRQDKNDFFKEINSYYIKYCHSFFLKLLNSKDGSFLLKKDNFDYLSKNLGHYLEKDNLKRFSTFLKKIKKEPNVSLLIKNLINSFYKNNKKKYPPIILSDFINNESRHLISLDLKEKENQKSKEIKKQFKKINSSFKNFYFEKSKNLVIDSLSFYFKNRELLDNRYAWKKFTNIGKRFLYRDHYDFATSIFQTSSIFNPKSQENEALFLILWSHLLRKDFRGAQNFILKENLIEKFDKLNSKLRFWVALSLKNNGEGALAKTLYKDIINLNPLSFYSIISLKELNKSSKQNKEDQIISSEKLLLKKNLNIKDFRSNFINSIRRLLVWINLEDYKFEKKEIEHLINLKPNKVYKKPKDIGLTKNNHEKFLFIEVVKLLADRGKHLRSFKMILKSLTFKKFILNQHYLEILFPFEYYEQIKKIDKSIDPIIILSLIRQESAFNPKAISRVGARGLMQIMPSTAKIIKKEVKGFQLKNPNLNLKIGIKYFKQLLNKYKGNLIYTLAAYNAGESRIESWKKNIFNSTDPLSIIESIPFKETRNYVKLIYRNIFFYKWLEKKSNLAVPLRDSFKISFKAKH